MARVQDLLADADDAVRLVRGTLRRGETGEVLRELRRSLGWSATEAGLGSARIVEEGGTAIRVRRAGELLLVARSGCGPETLRDVVRGAARRTGGAPFLKSSRGALAAPPRSPRLGSGADEEASSALAAALARAFPDPRGLAVRLEIRRVFAARAVIGPRSAVSCGTSERLEASGTFSRGRARRPFSFQSSREMSEALPALATALTEASRPLAGIPPPSGLIDVVLAPAAAAVFWHEAVGHMLEADARRAAASILGRVVGAAVAPPGVDVWDEPTRDDLPGGYTHDDEGTPARAVPLLEDGFVREILTDCRSAGADSNGHGRAADFREAPRPRMSNLVVRPGGAPLEELVERCGAGLLVNSVSSGAADPESGRFVLRVEEGFTVRRGQVGAAVASFSLTGDVLSALAALDPERGDSSPAGTSLSLCVKGGAGLPVGGAAPALLVRSLSAGRPGR